MLDTNFEARKDVATRVAAQQGSLRHVEHFTKTMGGILGDRLGQDFDFGAFPRPSSFEQEIPARIWYILAGHDGCFNTVAALLLS